MLVQNSETNKRSTFQITLAVVDLDVITELEKHEEGHCREKYALSALRLGVLALRQAAGELDGRFDSWELAYGFYGQTNFYITAHLLMPGFRANRKAAERVVELFLAGAGAKRKRGQKKS